MPAVLSASTPNVQSLFSQSESKAFQSFLSSMDYPEDAIPADEWAAFSASGSSLELSLPDEGRQALTKATKDLMSLDTNTNWNSPNHSPVIHPHFEDHGTLAVHQYDQQQRHRDEHRRHQSYSSRPDSFPFLHTKSHQQQQSQLSPLTASSESQQQHPPNSSHSPYGLPQQQQPLHQARIPQQGPQKQPGRSQNTSSGTRPKRSHQQPSKSNLLSLSQKKANHIQSEQKRRANIRRGYAALCDTVPALREAIKEEEEAERMAAANLNTTAVVGADVKTNGAGKKRKNKKDTALNGNHLDDKDKDKLDGRAGPRSENIVLAKTIEHIQYLLTERSSLLARLQRARALLPTGHPALTTLDPDPPWEREWKGGEGKLDLGDGDGEEDGGSGDEEVG